MLLLGWQAGENGAFRAACDSGQSLCGSVSRLDSVNATASSPLVDQLQLKSIFRGIRGLTGMFSIYARWKMRGFWFLGGFLGGGGAVGVVLVLFLFGRILASLTHYIFK